MKKHFFTIYVAVLLSLLTLGIVTGIISHRETVKSKKAAEVATVEEEEEEPDVKSRITVRTEDIIKGDNDGVIKDGSAKKREAPVEETPFVVTPRPGDESNEYEDSTYFDGDMDEDKSESSKLRDDISDDTEDEENSDNAGSTKSLVRVDIDPENESAEKTDQSDAGTSKRDDAKTNQDDAVTSKSDDAKANNNSRNDDSAEVDSNSTTSNSIGNNAKNGAVNGNSSNENSGAEETKPQRENVADESKSAIDDDIAMGELTRPEPEPEKLNFVDVYGEHYQIEVDQGVRKHDYNLSCFKNSGNYVVYDGDNRYTYRLGIDVSHHDGDIDWDAVEESGIDFVILRIGYRGYGAEGLLNEDKKFREYIDGAHEAGLDVGVYIFSQAVDAEEAREEARLVLNILDGYHIELPVVFDPESVLDANARTDYVSGEQFTENAITFCQMIKDAGYQPMIYSNMMWEAFKFDLKKLSEYPIWYADYEQFPQTPYHFEYWQYSNTGKVPGIQDMVDLDIQLIPVSH